MSISATCPGCRTSYQLADTMSGKRVRCKSCSEVFAVGSRSVASERDEDDERIQASPRPARRPALRDLEDEDYEDPRPRRRPRKASGNSTLVPLLIAGGVLAGVLGLVLVGVGVWAFARSQHGQSPPVASAPNLPPPNMPGMRFPRGMPPPAADPNPAANNGNANMPPMGPPGNPFGQPPAQAGGPLKVELSNAKISGFGPKMEVSVDYRFTTGNPAGRRLFLLIKAKNVGRILQNYYVAEIRTIGNQTQGTISAAGMSFGIDNGPFEIWLGEGSPPIGMLLSDRDLQPISNTLTVANKQFSPPGMRPPFGPRGMLP